MDRLHLLDCFLADVFLDWVPKGYRYFFLDFVFLGYVFLDCVLIAYVFLDCVLKTYVFLDCVLTAYVCRR